MQDTHWQKPFIEGNEGRIVYQEESGLILCGDCLEVMAHWPEKCVDLVLTDPPYGIDFDRAGWADRPEDYESLMRQLVPLWTRLSRSAVFCWQALINAPVWHKWFPEQFRIFAACKGFVQFRPTSLQWSWDPVIFWGDVKGEPDVCRKDWHVQFLAPFGLNREKIEHPCPRPLEQVCHLLALVSEESDIALDGMCGSGTTCVAAKKLGRRYVGIDISRDYCEIAKERLIALDTGVPVKEARAGQAALPFQSSIVNPPQADR